MTLAQINAELESLETQRAQAKKALSTQEELRRTQSMLQSQLEAAHTTLVKENRDVEQLNSITPTALLAKLTGQWEEKMEKEQREADAAALRYKSAQDALARIDSELQVLNCTQVDLQALEVAYQGLLTRKEVELRLSGSPVSQELTRLHQALADLNAQKKEVLEALLAAEALQSKLNQMAEALTSAQSLGTWDMFGGGLLVSLAKHEKIQAAQALGQEASQALSRFQRELADVQVTTLSGDITTPFSAFADVWFDGLFADWMVQTQIHTAQENLYTIRSQVSAITQTLTTQRDDLNRQLSQRKAQQETLLQNN